MVRVCGLWGQTDHRSEFLDVPVELLEARHTDDWNMQGSLFGTLLAPAPRNGSNHERAPYGVPAQNVGLHWWAGLTMRRRTAG